MPMFTVKALQKCVYNNALYDVGDELLFEADKVSDVPKHMKILHAPKEAAMEEAVVSEKSTAEEIAAEGTESGKQSEETEKGKSEAVAEKDISAAQPKKKNSKK